MKKSFKRIAKFHSTKNQCIKLSTRIESFYKSENFPKKSIFSIKKSSKQSKSSSKQKKYMDCMHANKVSSVYIYLFQYQRTSQNRNLWFNEFLFDCVQIWLFSSQSDKNNHWNRCWNSNSARTSECLFFYSWECAKFNIIFQQNPFTTGDWPWLMCVCFFHLIKMQLINSVARLENKLQAKKKIAIFNVKNAPATKL